MCSKCNGRQACSARTDVAGAMPCYTASSSPRGRRVHDKTMQYYAGSESILSRRFATSCAMNNSIKASVREGLFSIFARF